MRIAPISESVNILPDKERFLSENERFDVSEATGVGEKRGSFRAYRKPIVRKAEDMSEKRMKRNPNDGDRKGARGSSW